MLRVRSSRTVGSAGGGGEDGLKLSASSAAVSKSGARAPGMGAAVQGGWRAPDGSKPTADPATVPTPSSSSSSSDSSSDSSSGAGKAPSSSSKPSVLRANGGGGGRKGGAGSGGGVGFVSAALAKARRRMARVAHGLVMGLAWLGIAPGAALVARHGRKAPW